MSHLYQPLSTREDTLTIHLSPSPEHATPTAGTSRSAAVLGSGQLTGGEGTFQGHRQALSWCGVGDMRVHVMTCCQNTCAFPLSKLYLQKANTPPQSQNITDFASGPSFSRTVVSSLIRYLPASLAPSTTGQYGILSEFLGKFECYSCLPETPPCSLLALCPICLPNGGQKWGRGGAPARAALRPRGR